MDLQIRKTFSQVEEVNIAGGQADSRGPLRKVAAGMVIENPFADQAYVENLSPLIEASGEIGTTLGTKARELLGDQVESYGKGGIAGTAGEQEHVNAALTSIFGNAFREAIGGGEAWITSVTKVGVAGTVIDVPTAYKDEVWVRSHYDAIEVRIPDAPAPSELVVLAVVTNRGRLNARVGGKTVDEAKREKQRSNG